MRILSSTTIILLTLIINTASFSRTDAADQKNRIVPEGSKVEQLWNKGSFTEGVAVAPDGRIYWSDIPFDKTPGRIMRFDPATKKIDVACAKSGKSNGLMFDQSGSLIAACGAAYGIRALGKLIDGKMKVMVNNYQGKKFNSLNDLVIHPNGGIYFTDPRYVGGENIDLDHQSVYFFDPHEPHESLKRVTTDIGKPNGVIISPDGKTLYVAETDNGITNAPNDQTKGKTRMTLNAFVINRDHTLGKKQVLIDFGKAKGIDGMTVDETGNIYAAVRNPKRFGIIVYNPKGKELAYIPTPTAPTNCTFGKKKETNVLYITAGKGLYRITLNSKGYHSSK